MLRRLLIAALFIIITDTLSAQSDEVSVVNADTLIYSYTPLRATPAQRFANFSEALESYMTDGLTTSRPINFTVIGGPGYSADTGLRLSVVGNLRYHTSGVEPLSHTLTMRIMASLKGCYGADIKGVNYIANSRNRLIYSVCFGSMPTLIYGFDYDASARNIAGRYTARRCGVKVGYERSVGRLFALGATLDYRYEDARAMDARAGEIIGDATSLYHGAGIAFMAALRGSKTEDINVKRGVDVGVEAMLRPALLGVTQSDIWQLSATLDWYQPLWRGGLLALDVYGEYQSANTPWMLRAKLGSDSRMRGYYPGQYNGNVLLVAQAELRQYVWAGLVGVVWGGGGVAFSALDSVQWRKVLPNYGVGIRWYMGLNTAIRIDVGFGRGCYNFVVGLNEAF